MKQRLSTLSSTFTIFLLALRHDGATMAPMMKAAKDSCAKTERITVRLPDNMLAEIDAECSRRIGNVSRNTWILEAVQEKLSRGGGGANKQSDAERGN
ncbi:ribbon-helix-helix domain-containing protein [Burkholderia vietnamiensis]|uniref:ribbon-helix-helix domain-containing protein n=1 Tax=Burkholderia vietnamiensis TaxID=60552 RepID=UPI001E3F881F|nr:ribbon-helix-helix domain-containing protein [Burkholderia vietnamiensis]